MAELRKLFIDGLTIETTLQGEEAINKLTKQLGDAQASTKTLADAHAVALAAKDDALTKLQAALDDAKTKIMTDAQIDTLVKDRADLVAVAKGLHDADYTGKSADEIRKAVVAAKFGDAAVTGQADAYIKARFDIAVEDAAKNADPVRAALKDQASNPGANPAADARAKMLADMATAHSPKQGA